MPTPVIVLLADGLRADTLRDALDSGALPAMRALREAGALCEVTSTFPSVTGPAYIPFLVGRFPAGVGVPALRWFDRARTATSLPDYARSYVGYQMSAVNRDLDAGAPTIFELVPGSAAALSMITRGLPRRDQLAVLDIRSAVRAIRTHFSGDLDAWLAVDRETSEKVVRRVRETPTPFVFAAFMGVDKLSHAQGQEGPRIIDALRVVDDTVARLRRPGQGSMPRVWVASDHGHSPVERHDDVHDLLQSRTLRVMSHPWVYRRRADVAVMVSGNAMAHLYLELGHRTRPFWPALETRWHGLAEMLLARQSVDLMLVPMNHQRCSVWSATRGRAIVTSDQTVLSYHCETGDPLGIGRDLSGVDRTLAWEATLATDYPDSLVQIANLASSTRCGDLVLSASRGWDFRSRYEPIPHRSSHGALHRDHMLVPLLLDQPPRSQPRRTTDVFASAVAAVGARTPARLDGQSFL